MLKKIALIIFSAAIALSLAACDIPETAFSADDVKVSSGLYMYFMFNAYMEASDKHADTEVDLLDATIEDVAAKDWIKNKAKEYSTEYIAIEKKFSELELAFTEEELNTVSQNASYQYQQYQQYYSINGVSERTYYLYAKNLSKKQKIFASIYDDEGSAPIGADNMKSFFAEKYALTTEIAFSKTNAEGGELDEAGLAEVKAKAEGYAQRIRDGEDIEKLIVEYDNEKAKAEAAAMDEEEPTPTEVAEDADSSTIISNVAVSDEESVAPKIVSIFETVAVGAVGVVEDDTSYYVVKRGDVLADESKFDDYKSQIMYDMKGKEFEETVDSWTAELNVKTDSRIIGKYSADKVKLNDTQAQ
jgi:hypothetical protein